VDIVLFACVHNAGRSQMAAAFFNQQADPRRAVALSAGTRPALHVHPEVLETMREVGVDLVSMRPRLLTRALAESASLLVTMGCGEACPAVPGLQTEDWPVPDPKDAPVAEVRRVRDEVQRRVAELLAARGWARQPARSRERR
jgi:arsenate reductase (thioredoxin)